MTWLQHNDEAQDAILKSKRLVLKFSIKKHTTPASKVHACEYPGFMELRSEGKTSAADAIDDGTTFTTANDANGIFGLLLHDIEVVDEVKLVSVTADAGTVAATGASTFTIENNIFDGSDAVLGPLGRIVVTTDGSGSATVSSVFVAQES